VADSDTIVKILAEKFPTQVTAIELNPKQAAVEIDPQIVVRLFEFIKNSPELKMDYLSCISGVDSGTNIDLVYFIGSIEYKHKLTVRTKVDRIGGKIDTISQVIPGANWFEREIWELYGVEFTGHPNLTRFLLPEDWDEGNPMLRDWTGKNFVKMPEISG
jgi:NADH-quinone oxidoreductase subunit C